MAEYYHYVVLVDKSTGVALEKQAIYSVNGRQITFEVSFETLAFSVAPPITLPDVQVADPGQGGGQSGGEGGDPGQGAETGTTVIAVYPSITSALTFERLTERGIQASVSMTYTGSEAFTFTYGEVGNVIYYKTSAGGEYYFDVTENDYYVCYAKQDDEWAAARIYYADDDSEYENRAELIKSMRETACSILLLETFTVRWFLHIGELVR